MKKLEIPEFNFKFKPGFEAFDYQQETFNRCIDHMRKSKEPAYVYASVSAGKSLLIAMLAKHFQNVNEAARYQGMKASHQILMIVRTGDLVQQNAEEAWGIGCKNSVFCAGLGMKSTQYPCIMGSEKSIYNGLNKELKQLKPTLILIDEAHTLNDEDENTQMRKIISEMQDRNPNVRIIGLTGSPWRGKRRMLDGDFWKHELIKIDREYLTKRGFVMPVEFGFGDNDTRYESIVDTYTPEEGDDDFTSSQLAEIERRILKEGTHTQKIMLDVTKRMASRNLALITLSGRKHCEEAAKYLPEGSYAIIDKDTPTKERLKIKEKCNTGKLKYVLQIGTWTVGVSIPRIDTIVIMRPIGSMTLYEQLVGRGVRRLKPHDIKAGIIKNECYVVDYTDTSSIMAARFSSDELDKAEQQRAKQSNEELVTCPKCDTENSMRARRCCGHDNNGERCDFFFSSKICEDLRGYHDGRLIKKGCGAENDPTAKLCRKCGGFMRDPAEKLLNQAYTKDDLIPVVSFKFGPTKAKDKLMAYYKLANGKNARELFDIAGKEQWKRGKWNSFVKAHVKDEIKRKALSACKNIDKAMEYAEFVLAPTKVTHRVNEKGFDLINRKVFE